jgi:hypothetical protein
MKWFLPCCFACSKPQNRWYFRRAPEPTDIIWEHMNVHICKRFINYLFSFVATVAIMGICFYVIEGVKSFKNIKDKDFKDKKKDDDDLDLYETGVAKIISWSASLAVVIVNEALLVVMRRFSLWE